MEDYRLPEKADYFRARGYWKDDTIVDYLSRTTEQFPDKVGIVDSYTRLTWKEVEEQAQALALHLLEMGIAPRDRVMVQLPNWHEFVIAYCGINTLGAIPVVINPVLRDGEASFILRHSGASAIIVPAEFGGFNYVDMVRRIRPEIPLVRQVIIVDHAGREWPEMANFRNLVQRDILDRYDQDYLLPYRPQGNDIDSILYTSGTMGSPKGVITTHNIHDYSNKTFCLETCITKDDGLFPLSPLSFQFTITQGLYSAVYSGAKLVIMEKFDGATAIQTIKDENCTFLFGPPPFLMSIIDAATTGKHEVKGVRAYFCGGAHLPPEVVRKAKEVLKCQLINGYGLTETACALMTRLGDTDEVVVNSAGKPFPPAMEAKIVDDEGREVNPGETGEIMFRGPSVTTGYFRNPAADAAAFTADGWFKSGDLVEKRRDGNITIVGRKKDMIKRGGISIYPEEVEDLLLQHPKINRCAMVGMPDERLAERNCLFVVPKPGVEICLEEIASYLDKEKRIAKYKLPERLELVAVLPLTPTGKILKRELREVIIRKLAEEATP